MYNYNIQTVIETIHNQGFCQTTAAINEILKQNQHVKFVAEHFLQLKNNNNKQVGKEEKSRLEVNRDKLVWIILQYVSAGIEKTNLNELINVIKLVHLLYYENYVGSVVYVEVSKIILFKSLSVVVASCLLMKNLKVL